MASSSCISRAEGRKRSHYVKPAAAGFQTGVGVEGGREAPGTTTIFPWSSDLESWQELMVNTDLGRMVPQGGVTSLPLPSTLYLADPYSTQVSVLAGSLPDCVPALQTGLGTVLIVSVPHHLGLAHIAS
jgi:hypothetical protein